MAKGERLPVPSALLPPPTGALTRQYQGQITEREARRLLTTTIRLDADVLTIIDEIVGSPQTEYQSRGDFIRHALMELLNVWLEHGFPHDYISDVLTRLREEKINANRLKMRQEFTDILNVYEQSLAAGAQIGDWKLVIETLGTLEGYVSRTKEPYWREHLRKTIALSKVVQHAISQLYEAARDLPELEVGDERLDNLAEFWQKWLESLT